MAFIQVGRETHQADLRQTEVCQLNVAQGGDEEAVFTMEEWRGAERSSDVESRRLLNTTFGDKYTTTAGESVCVLLVRLEVSVHDAVVVQVLERQHRLSKVHASHVHRQRAHVLQQGGTVSTCRGQHGAQTVAVTHSN